MTGGDFSCSDITPQLNGIWRQFGAAGITDDLAIIEYIAYFLFARKMGLWENLIDEVSDQYSTKNPMKEFDFQLRDKFSPTYLELIPSYPQEIGIDQLQSIHHILSDILQNVQAGPLLNHCVIFRLQRMLAGGRYPTARHIAKTMVKLVELNTEESLGDLACGSGGLLVSGAEYKPQITGVEISPNWARITFTNAVLHNLPDPDIRIGNTFSVFSVERDSRSQTVNAEYENTASDGFFSSLFSGKPLVEKPKFDCILMNPPFGEAIDPSLIHHAFGGPVSGRSETLLTAIALEALKTGGRMAVLLPSGVLFASSGGELDLKSNIMEIYHPQALISLPKDTFQPYSNNPTNILLIHNPKTIDAAPVERLWFYRVLHDGFSGGRNRQPEPERSELPRLESAVLIQSKEADAILGHDGQNINVRQIRLENSYIAGYSIERMGNKEISFDLSLLQSVTDKRESGLYGSVRNAKPLGSFYLSGKRIFQALPETETINIQLPLNNGKEKTFQVSDDEAGSFTLIVQAQEGQITKGNKSHSLTISDKPPKSNPFGFVIGLDGNPNSSYLIFENLEWAGKRKLPCCIELLDEDEQLKGLFVLFETPEIQATKLEAKRRIVRHLVDLDTGKILVNLMKDGLTNFLYLTETPKYSLPDNRSGVAVSSIGDVFGIAVPVDEIQKNNLDLQPSTYFPPEIPEEIGSPAEILAVIKKKQHKLNQRLDFLLGISEQRSPSKTELPSPISSDVQPVGVFTGMQKVLWKHILTMVDPSQDEERDINVARPFQLNDFGQDFPLDDVERTFQLFESMGLIVQVSVQGASYYRLVTEKDILGLEQE